MLTTFSLNWTSRWPFFAFSLKEYFEFLSQNFDLAEAAKHAILAMR